MSKPIRHLRNPDGSESVFWFVRVLLLRDGRHVVAQGLDVDYCAAGDSLAEAKENFTRGFIATIEANLREFGSIDSLIAPAPAEFFRLFYKAEAAAEPESKDLDLPDDAPRKLRRLQFFQGEALSAA